MDNVNTQSSPNATESADTQNQTCPNCGMQQADWRGNDGKGFQLGSKTYCCQGCATGTGCTCK